MTKISRIIGLSLLLVALPVLLAAKDHERVMVGEDIFVAPDETLHEVVCIGCSIRVEGQTREVVAIGGNIEVEGRAEKAVAIGGNVDISGRADREVVSIGGNVTVAGSVGGKAVSVFGNVTLREGAEVGGDVTSVGGRVHGADLARVGGRVNSVHAFLPMMRFGFVLMFLAALVAGLVVQPLLAVLAYAVMGERRVWVLAETTRRRAGMSFLLGLGVVFAWFMFSAIGAITPFGFPFFSFPLWIVIFLLLVVGYTGISYWVGRGLLSSSGGMAVTLLGAVLVTILQLIPLLGWMAFSIFSLMAMGSALLSGFGTSTEWLIKSSDMDPMARPMQRT